MVILPADWLYEVPIPPRVRGLVGIYVLTHPDTNEVVYVGQSNAPGTRLNDHIRWWQKAYHYVPKMYVIEEVAESLADEREVHYINHYIAQGASILNYQANEQAFKSRVGQYSYTIEDMQRVAAHYDGECLSHSFLGVRNKLQWKCKRGHTWEAVPITILKGSWCPKSECSRERRGQVKNSFTKRPRHAK